ncbi:hypothetical protein Agub_g5579 [Astrephomene gubernaculifera]|uniref:Protein kinase domain-containing protein n=1 Tax=Astrephomene gubernaculifera TaxID=47775 RepID=A0AAD3HKT3_9CHLO|nr:hypothetical protein Agub_g5579 [Astrephomene gubernaculifera]
MPASSVGDSETRSVNSFASSFSQRSFFGKLNKYELKRRFYEKLDDFKNKVLLHKEQGFIVYRARCMYSGGVVVLKGYSRESLTLQTRQRVFSEVSLLQRAQCPFILKCFDSFEDQGWWWLVLENCAAGDLYRIVQQSGPIREEGWLVSQVLLPILQTLAYLHAEGVIHRDIKPEHVLFNSEKVAKLSGFFLSWDVNRYSYPKDMVGTLDYVAPEVFVLNGPNAKQQQVTHYDYKVDIWGVGIMSYDVLVGSPPFNTDDPNTTVEAILLREAEYPDFMSDDAVDFIDQCLTKDPAKRPTARQLLTHPWIRANLDWEPPEEFDDPIPNIDFSYYRVGGQAGEGLEDSGDEEEDGRRWYNPLTWIKRRTSLEDLLAPDPHDTPPAPPPGPGAGGQPGGGGGGGVAGPRGGAGAAGGWRLTHSLSQLARNFMGNRVQVAPDQQPSPLTGGSSGLGGLYDISSSPAAAAAAAAGGLGGGGLGSSSGSSDGGVAEGGGKKAFQMLPGRSMKREDLQGVPEGDEEGLDPESGQQLLGGGGGVTNGSGRMTGGSGSGSGTPAGLPVVGSLKASFSSSQQQQQRPYSPPSRPGTPLHGANGVAAAATEPAAKTTPTWLTSDVNGGRCDSGSSMTAAAAAAAAALLASGGGSGKKLAVACAIEYGSGGGGGGGGAMTPTKAPAFLPYPAAAAPVPPTLPSSQGGGDDVTLVQNVDTAGAGAIEVAPGGGGGIGRTTAAAVLPRRLVNPNAHDSATSSEMRRSGSSNASRASPRIPAAPPFTDTAAAVPDAGSNISSPKGTIAAAAATAAAAAAAGAAAASSPSSPASLLQRGGSGEGSDLLPLLPSEKLHMAASEDSVVLPSPVPVPPPVPVPSRLGPGGSGNGSGGGSPGVSGSIPAASAAAGGGGGAATAAAVAAAVSGAAVAAASVTSPGRPLPHLSSAVIQSVEDETAPGPEATHASSPFLVPSCSGMSSAGQPSATAEDLRAATAALSSSAHIAAANMASANIATAVAAAAAALSSSPSTATKPAASGLSGTPRITAAAAAAAAAAAPMPTTAAALGAAAAVSAPQTNTTSTNSRPTAAGAAGGAAAAGSVAGLAPGEAFLPSSTSSTSVTAAIAAAAAAAAAAPTGSSSSSAAAAAGSSSVTAAAAAASGVVAEPQQQAQQQGQQQGQVLLPVLPAGGSRTTPREREDARLLTHTSDGGEA